MKSGIGQTLAARTCLRLFWVSALITLVFAGSLAPYLRDSAEMVRMRNALLLQNEAAAYDWTPDTVPEGFALERGAPSPLYANAVVAGDLKVEGDDWATALKIGRHLLFDGKRTGRPIQSNLEQTYRRITERGEGYCGDFADSFTGLANAAGLFSRPWAFSFDGFGGHGHIFNEIWDRKAARWIMIDVFNNFFVVDGTGRPLSAIEFRRRLETDASDLQLLPVDSASSPGFVREDKALEYYRRGLPEWYMWWGNNVFEYDQDPVVSALGNTHRALEQLGGVAVGAYPRIHILATSENLPQREAISWLRVRLIAVMALGSISVALLICWLILRRREADMQS